MPNKGVYVFFVFRRLYIIDFCGLKFLHFPIYIKEGHRLLLPADDLFKLCGFTPRAGAGFETVILIFGKNRVCSEMSYNRLHIFFK